MSYFIVAGILLVLAFTTFAFAPAVVGSFLDKAPEGRHRLWGLVWLTLFLVFTVFMSITQVHAKELGVETSFGKPVGELNAGLHWKRPWAKVTKINETIFTDEYTGDHALPVRLGDGNTATVSATIRWHVDPAAATYVYANYRSNDPAESLRDSVVDTQFKAVVNEEFSKFNPTALIQQVDTTDPVKASRSLNFSPDYEAFSASVQSKMGERVKDADGTPLVVLDSVTVSGLQYSSATEARINLLVAQVAKTQQAVQQQATNTAQARANEILQNSLSNSPLVLVSKCFDELADKDFVPPAGFSCWPNGGSAVVIPATK